MLNFWLFHMVDKLSFNPRGDLDLPIFPPGRQSENVLLTVCYLYPT